MTLHTMQRLSICLGNLWLVLRGECFQTHVTHNIPAAQAALRASSAEYVKRCAKLCPAVSAVQSAYCQELTLRWSQSTLANCCQQPFPVTSCLTQLYQPPSLETPTSLHAPLKVSVVRGINVHESLALPACTLPHCMHLLCSSRHVELTGGSA